MPHPHLQPQTPRRNPPTHNVTVTPLPRHRLLSQLLVLRERAREQHVEIRVTHGLRRVVVQRAHGSSQIGCLAGAGADGLGSAAFEQARGSGFVPEMKI